MGNICGTCIGEETVDTFVANAALFPAACSGESAFQPSRRVFCDEAVLNHTDTLPRFLDGGQTPKSSSDFLRDIVPSLDGRGHKGQAGRICGPDGERVLECSEDGAPRRPGGLGDFLAGSLGTILAWACLRKRDKLHACVAASVVVRRACRAAYLKKKRAMVAPDVLEEVGAAFEELCPANSRL